jgi:hypothetical protein
MAKLIFNIDNDNFREASNIELIVPDDMDIWEYKIMCTRLASAMGYTESTIKRAFGEEQYNHTEDELRFREFLEIINVYTGSLINTI